MKSNFYFYLKNSFYFYFNFINIYLITEIKKDLIQKLNN